MEDNYREKYLKYKVKYLELKANLDNQEAFGKKEKDANAANVRDYISNGGNINELKLKQLPKDFKIELQRMISDIDHDIAYYTKYHGTSDSTNTIEYKRNISLPSVEERMKQDNCDLNSISDKCNKHNKTKQKLEDDIEKLENEVAKLNQVKSRIEEVLKILKP